MSFDLYVLDVKPVPGEFEALGEILEDLDDDETPLTQGLSALLAELGARYPDLTADSIDSPWAGPLKQSSGQGKCCAFNLMNSAASTVGAEVVDAARAHGLTTFDPQTGMLIEPDGTSFALE
jgi:hypothetical protein